MRAGEQAVIIPDAQVVRSQAASWLLRRRDFDVWTEEDQKSLDAWLEGSLAHRVAYLRLEAIWQDADRLTVLRARSGRGASVALRGFAAQLTRAVAVLAVAVGIGAAGYVYLSRAHEQSYATAIGERKVVKLADGSRVELNTDTSLRISGGLRDRRVTLERGEAFFRIAHDPSRKFVVDAGDYRVVDLGTQFVIRREQDKLDLDLIEGRAQLESPAGGQKPVLLSPGDTVTATADMIAVGRKTADRMADALGWRHGVLVFHRTPLAEVATQYNRYNMQKIDISDPSIAQRTVTATLPTNDLAAFARIAKDFFGLHVTERGNEIVISR